MAKEVKNRISLDASGFERGTAQVKRNIKALEKGLTIDMKTAAKLATGAILGVGAALAGIGTGLAVGINGVIELGGKLNDLSGQTGIAVDQLLVLQQAFKDNGVEPEKVGASIAKMGKAISEAQQKTGKGATAFDALGLSAEKLIRMTPADQYKAIGDAILAVENPTQRAALAMEVFGKSGAELINTFGGGKLDDAAGSLGAQSALLAKNAELFDRAGDILGRAGNKLQGFFVGIADQVVPVILPLLEAFDKLDLAGQGQRFGESLATGLRVLIGAFQNDQLGALITNSLLRAGAEFINLVARGWAGIGIGFFQAFVKGWGITIDVVKNGLIGAAQGFGAVFLQIIATALAKIPGLKGVSESVEGAAVVLLDKSAQNLTTAGQSLGGYVSALQTAFENGMADMDGFNLIDTADMDAQRKAIIEAALKAVPAIGEGAAKLLEPKPLAGPIGEPIDLGGGAGKLLQGGVSSLAAIGGGGGVGRVGGVESLVDQSQKQTSLLGSINNGVKDLTAAVLGKTGGGQKLILA
jgi:hypothetical protein